MGSSESEGSQAVTCNLCNETKPQKDTIIFDEYFYCSECTATTDCENCSVSVSVPKDSIESPVLCGECADHQSSNKGFDGTALAKAILVLIVPFAAYAVTSGGSSLIEIFPGSIPRSALSIGGWILLYVLYRLFKIES